MKNTKLVSNLQTIPDKEFKHFNDFINSPYTNKSDYIIKLWGIIKIYAPDFEHKNLTKEYLIPLLYEEISPNTIKKFTGLLVTFNRLFLKFILFQQLQKEEKIKEKLLVKATAERELNKIFFETIKKAKRKIEKLKAKDISDYEHYYFLEYERYFSKEVSKHNLKDNGMQVILDTIKEFTALLTTKNLAEAKQMELFINRKFDFSSINTPFIDNTHNNSLIEIFTLIYELFQSKKEDWQKANLLFNKFNTSINIISSRREKKSILNFIINYASHHYKFDDKYYRLLFDAQKLGIEANLLMEQQQLYSSYFISTAVIACELKETEWLKTLINEYTKFIKKDHRKIAILIGEINLSFSKGDFEKTITLINLYKQLDKDLLKELWLRIIELRSFFELDLLKNSRNHLIDNKVEAFKLYCYRHKKDFSKHIIQSNTNFLKHFKKLLDWQYLNTEERKKVVFLVNNEATVCRLWLNAKIKTLS